MIYVYVIINNINNYYYSVIINYYIHVQHLGVFSTVIF